MLSSQELYALLGDKGKMVISTVSAAGHPESAYVAYTMDEDKLVFGTDTTTRKFTNLKANARVALVIGFDDVASIQLEGEAEPLAGDELERARERHVAKFPQSKSYAYNPTQQYIVIRLSWARLTDFSNGERIEEWHRDAR